MARALNRKQLAFVEKYLEGVRSGTPNGTSAYMTAFQCRSRDAARSAAARLLKDVRVQELLHPAREAAEVARVEQVASIEITRDRIRLELARVGFVNVKNLFHPDGRRKQIAELDDATAAALASFEVEEETTEGEDGGRTTITRTIRYKLLDKLKALQLLGDTEPGVWCDPKQSGSTTNVNVTATAVARTDITLTPEDLDAVARILEGTTVMDRVDIYTAALRRAAGREDGKQTEQPR